MATPPDFTAGAVLTAAQMNQIGLWKIVPTVSGTGVTVAGDGTVTLTNSTSAIITGCFPNDFTAFQVIIQDIVGSTTANDIRLQLRGASTITSNYRSNGIFRLYTGAAGDIGNVTGYIGVGNAISTGRANGIVDILNPNVATITGFITMVSNHDAMVYAAGQNTNTTAYNNCEFSVASGNMSGKISFYGYNT